jgi:hypothetical protein
MASFAEGEGTDEHQPSAAQLTARLRYELQQSRDELERWAASRQTALATEQVCVHVYL